MIKDIGIMQIQFYQVIQAKLGLTWRQANKPSKANKAKIEAELAKI